MRIALFAAFPQEVRCIVRELRPLVRSSHPFLWRTAKHLSLEIDLVQTGMGTLRAQAALHHLLARKMPDLVVSTGFCGALYQNATLGDLIRGTRVLLCHEEQGRAILPEGRQLSLDHGSAPRNADGWDGIRDMTGGYIITLQKRIRKEALKRILTADMTFPVCDMETFPLALLSLQRGIPFLALRAVTDLHHEDILEAFFGTADGSGSYRTVRAVRLLLLRPGLIPSALRLGRASSLAAKSLWRGLHTVIETLS